jgi:hypothetical protein
MNTSHTIRPSHEIRLGRIKASVWANPQETGVRYNVTVSRLYKDNENKWRTSDSFGRDDIPLVRKVLDIAHTWMFEQQENLG